MGTPVMVHLLPNFNLQMTKLFLQVKRSWEYVAHKLTNECKKAGLAMEISKTKYLLIGKESEELDLGEGRK